MLNALSKFLLGYDVFISYSYADGRAYAEALEDRLSNLDYSCFLDRKELPYGGRLTASLRRAIRRSRALVLIGTETAAQAKYVHVELVEALAGRRAKVIPVDVDGIRERIAVPEARELIWINEDESAARARAPSAAVLDGIARHFRFTRRNAIARRIVGALALVFLVLAIIAIWQWRVAVVERDTALSRQLAAQSKLLADTEPSPDTALLLGIEAAKRRETFEARDALLGALTRHPGLVMILHDAGRVRKVGFGPDGTELAATASQADATIWNLSSTPPSRRQAGADEASPYFSAPAAGDERITQLLATISSAGVKIRTSAISRDGTRLAVSDSEEITLWDVSTGRRLGDARAAQSRYVRALAFGPHEQLASGSSAGTIALWQLSEMAPIGSALRGLEVSANSLAFSADERQLAGGDYNGDIVIWDPASGEPTGPQMTGHRFAVNALRFCADGARLMSAAAEVIAWDLSSRQPIGSPLPLPEHSALAVSPDCSVVALGDNGGGVQFLDVARRELRHPPQKAHGNRIFALAFSPNGRLLASAGNDRKIVVWDVESVTPSGEALLEHAAPVSGLQFNADGRTLASLDSEGTLIVWDMGARETRGRPLRANEQYTAQSAVAMSADAALAATSGKDGVLHLWDLATSRRFGHPLLGHPGNVNAIVFSPRSTWLASAALGGSVILWDLRTDAWISAARRMANRTLSEQERLVYLPSR